MKSFTLALPLIFASLGVAAPSPALQKRYPISVTLYTEKNYGGQSFPVSVDIEGVQCVAPTFPSFMDAQASSVKVTDPHGKWYCRLSTAQGCALNDQPGVNATWTWNWDIPDLDKPCDPESDPECACDPATQDCSGYFFDNKARSMLCSSV